MKNVRSFVIVLALAAVLAFAAPVRVGAGDEFHLPPTVVFVQDSEDSMLIKNDTNYDKNFLIPGGADADAGFYVNAGQ